MVNIKGVVFLLIVSVVILVLRNMLGQSTSGSTVLAVSDAYSMFRLVMFFGGVLLVFLFIYLAKRNSVENYENK